MSQQYDWYTCAGAAALGVAVVFIASPFLRAGGEIGRLVGVGVFAAFYAPSGAALGMAWPGNGWRWAGWLISPLLLLILLSFSFAGGVWVLLTKDVPVIVAAAVAATAGASVGARLSHFRPQ